METAEDWAKYFGTVVMTERQYIELWDSTLHPEIKHTGYIALNGRPLEEVLASVAERRDMGDDGGIVGVLPPYNGPDDLIDILPRHLLRYPVLRQHWTSTQARTKVRLVFAYPDPHPQLADLAAVTFTPEMAIAQAKEHPFCFPGAHLTGPITEIKAALMTAEEVSPLLDHRIPPGLPGTVPGVLVCLVLIYGTFESPRHIFLRSQAQTQEEILAWLKRADEMTNGGSRSATSLPPRMTTGCLYQVYTTTRGRLSRSGGCRRDLPLPAFVSSGPL